MTGAGRPWTSDLSVAEFAALQSVGLDPVGQVLGSAVWLFAWSGRRACGSPGYISTGYGGSRRRLGPPRTMRGLVDTMYAARRAALQRMQDDAAALDADGVVAHDGYAVARMTRRWGATREVPRYSQLAELSRAQARTQLEQDVRRHAGQTAVVASIRVDVHEQQCSNAGGEGRDHLVETVIVGTSLAPFRRSDGHRGPTDVLPVLRLRPPAATGQQPEALLADPLLTTPSREPSR